MLPPLCCLFLTIANPHGSWLGPWGPECRRLLCGRELQTYTGHVIPLKADDMAAASQAPKAGWERPPMGLGKRRKRAVIPAHFMSLSTSSSGKVAVLAVAVTHAPVATVLSVGQAGPQLNPAHVVTAQGWTCRPQRLSRSAGSRPCTPSHWASGAATGARFCRAAAVARAQGGRQQGLLGPPPALPRPSGPGPPSLPTS